MVGSGSWLLELCSPMPFPPAQPISVRRETIVASEEVNNTRICESKRCVIVIFGSRLERTCGQYLLNELQHGAILTKRCMRQLVEWNEE